MPSPSVVASPKTRSREPDRWSPTPTSPTLLAQKVTLAWNDVTRKNVESTHAVAHLLEDQGHSKAAEWKFRVALTDLRNILPPMHPEIRALGYHLAKFYANHSCMKDADAVLNWMCEEHINRWGLQHYLTAGHTLHMVVLYRHWSRTDDAISLLHQAMKLHHKAFCVDFTRAHTSDKHRSCTITALTRQSHNIDGVKLLEPSAEFSTLKGDFLVSDKQRKDKDYAAACLLEALINQCERYPGRFITQAMEARTGLIRVRQMREACSASKPDVPNLGLKEDVEDVMDDRCGDLWGAVAVGRILA